MSPLTRQTIDGFFSEKQIAVIGASRKTHHFGRRLMDELRAKGFEVFPVNPNANQISDLPCHASIAEVAKSVAAALVVVPPSEQSKVTLECAQAGIKWLWIHGSARKEGLDPEILYACKEAGTEIISGHCPFMFIPGTGFPHNLHGWLAKQLGTCPH